MSNALDMYEQETGENVPIGTNNRYVKNEANFEAICHLVLVRMDDVESETPGGIYIPQDITDREEMAGTTATVIAIGPGAWIDVRNPPSVKVGDHVMISKFAGQLWKTKKTNKKYRVISDLSILGIIHDDDLTKEETK